MSTLPDYQQAQLLLEKNEIFVAPAEAHGVISGLLACGINIEADEYLGLLSDVFNDGLAFNKDLKAFDLEGYYFSSELSTENELTFLRDKAIKK